MPRRIGFTFFMCTILFSILGLIFLVLGISFLRTSATTDVWLMVGTGAIVFLMGSIPLGMFIRKCLMKWRVLRQGIMIETEFLDVTRASYSIDHWQPFIIRTQWLDQENHQVYHFKSRPLTYDPTRFLKEHMQIPVYILPNNPTQYFMDLKSAKGLKGIQLM